MVETVISGMEITYYVKDFEIEGCNKSVSLVQLLRGALSLRMALERAAWRRNRELNRANRRDVKARVNYSDQKTQYNEWRGTVQTLEADKNTVFELRYGPKLRAVICSGNGESTLSMYATVGYDPDWSKHDHT